MSDYLAMGGYGAYIWPAYGLSFVVLLGLVVFGTRRLARLEAELLDREGP